MSSCTLIRTECKESFIIFCSHFVFNHKIDKEKDRSQEVVALAFNLNTLEIEEGESLEFEDNLVYRASFRVFVH